MNLKNISISWKFLLTVLFLYVVFLAINEKVFYSAVLYSINLFSEVLLTFIVIFILMVLTDYFITPKFIIKHFGKNNSLKWFFVMIGGILSSGPVYMWYPLMAELKEKKALNSGMVACFLYNRAIKLPLLPMFIMYFGWPVAIVLFFVTIGISLLQGFIINKLIK
jgi:uncharacterized membrane protein YraQ (UPF0718 family)